MSESEHEEIEADEDEDGFLYHYTDLNALISIVEKKTIWASHIKYLNDSSEHRFLHERIIDRLLRPSVKTAVEAIELLNQLLLHQELFVSCFSEDRGDRLSQWRAYGGNSAVCLKFDKTELKRHATEKPEVDALWLRAVGYIAPEDDLSDLVEEIVPKLKAGRSSSFYLLVSILGSTVKHQAFNEEKEWRIVTERGSRKLKHRVRGSLLEPYIELEFKDLDKILAGVIVGPINHRDETAEAIKGLLQSNGFSNTEVKCSETPYRGF